MSFETYDYIVCGGGTAGCVVAGRLAEDPNAKVCVIEAGPDNKDLENVHMTGGWSQNFDKETDWNIIAEPTAGVNFRRVKNSRGRFLGGCSGLNGTLCIRGTKQDYDDWGLPGWSGEDMWRCFAKAETFHPKDWHDAAMEQHGTKGPLHTEPHDLAPISQRIMQSLESQGLPYNADMFTTGAVANGCGHAPRTVHQGLRTTGADFITKDQKRDNITIKTDCIVDKVVLEKKDGELVATGVEIFVKDAEKSTIVKATKDIVLSAGAYCSPAILMRSGIGAKDELTKVGIETAVDLPGVGKNLMDHAIVFAFYEVDKPGLTNDEYAHHTGGLAASYKLWKEKKTGFLSTFPFGAFAYARIEDRLQDSRKWREATRPVIGGKQRDPMGLLPNQPNIEFFNTELYGGPKQYIDAPGDGQHAFSIITELFSPRSRGTVTLDSKDARANPVVDHNYLADPLDLLVLSEGCAMANEVVMSGKGTKDVVKGAWPPTAKHHTFKTREDWAPYVREQATTCYHSAGTCKMGQDSDPMAVLDARLRVRGVKGLRVADCSSMPLLNQGHTQMPAYGIGERAAELVLEDHNPKAFVIR
ncbi:GMC oxidoreductase [Aplosporella prunicola CBS 121167]|uniref:GMC oxidoreductase n=1 Tax=Aplosporella prunicola CBS 121167 TaxID=1176127 RepID=A0A6A6AXT2_9PEZI|nr:GMC oxidoreductase [Aplosporella prunicola CBS 121167]KAF2135973.1 GMC oxidoreductase [Aplosporella prunicola CBS 121167]